MVCPNLQQMNSKYIRLFALLCIGFLFAIPFSIFAQTISGNVLNTGSGQKLAGVTIGLRNNALKTTTDSKGNFNLKVNSFPAVLQFSIIGYKPLQVKVTAATDSLVVLLENIEETLHDVVVTAGRTKQRLRDVPQKVELISAKDIAMTPALDVTDILKKNSAIDVIQYPGILSGVGFRGFRPQFSGLTQRTLLLINGRPAGTTNLGTLDLNYIDHIEVLKGPASALYGSQAMGGVVNIITPQSKGDIKGNVFADYGSFNTSQIGGKAGGNITSKLDFDLAATYFKRNNDFKMGKGNLFRNWLNSDSVKEYYSNGKVQKYTDARGDGQIRPNTRYGYYNTSARLGYQIDSVWRADIGGTIFRANDVESPGDIFSGDGGAGLKDIARNNSEASVTGKLGRNELSARLYYANESSTTTAIRTTSGAVVTNPYISGKTKYAWYGIQLKDAINLSAHHKLIVGYDYNNASSATISQSAPSATTGLQTITASAPDAAIISNGIYAQGQFSFLNDKLKVNPGLRLDISGFKLKPTANYTKTLFVGRNDNTILNPSLSTQYNFWDAFFIHGSIGRAFVTPDALQVAGYQVAGTGSGKVTVSQGNPDLKNESSISEELGLKYDRPENGLSADFTYFSTDVKNRIASVSAPPSPAYSIGNDVVTAVTNYFNANKSRIRGFELNLSYNFGALADFRYTLNVFTNMTRSLQAKDITINPTTGVATETAIQNVANTNLNFGIEYGNNRNYTIRLTGRYVGQRWDTDFNDALRPLVYYPEFIVADLSGNYQFNKNHQLGLTVNNLTDENYYEKRGYNQPGRAFRVRYTYTFGILTTHKKTK